MRVVFLEDVSGVAQGGDVKEVKNGFARNYLIPKSLAVPASHNALQGIERLKRQSEVTRLKTLADMKALGEELDGVQVNVEMRAGTGGRLYGSVTNAIVAERLSEMTDREIDRRTVEIAEPMRELGIFDVNVRVHPEVEARIKVMVYPTGEDPAEFEEGLIEDGEESEEDGADTTAVAEAAPVDSEEVEPEAEAILEDEPSPETSSENEDSETDSG